MIETDTSKSSKMDKTKKVALFVASNSARFVVSAAITAILPTETKLDKAKLFIGANILAGMVADRAKEYTSQKIDDLLNTANTMISEITETETETPNP